MTNNYGQVRIITSFNKTVLMAKDDSNNVITWNSTEFSRKTAAALSYNASSEFATKLQELGIDTVDITVKGPDPGRAAAIQALMDKGITIKMIKDITFIPHNFQIKRPIEEQQESRPKRLR